MSCGLQYCCSNSYHEGCIPVRGKGRRERGILPLSFYRNLKSFFKELLSQFFCCLTGCYIPFSLLVLYSNIFVLKETGVQSLVLHCFFSVYTLSFSGLMALGSLKFTSQAQNYFLNSRLVSQATSSVSPLKMSEGHLTTLIALCKPSPLTAILVNGTLLPILVNSNFLTVAQDKHWRHL